jgi:hypothetical protein
MSSSLLKNVSINTGKINELVVNKLTINDNFTPIFIKDALWKNAVIDDIDYVEASGGNPSEFPLFSPNWYGYNINILHTVYKNPQGGDKYYWVIMYDVAIQVENKIENNIYIRHFDSFIAADDNSNIDNYMNKLKNNELDFKFTIMGKSGTFTNASLVEFKNNNLVIS